MGVITIGIGSVIAYKFYKEKRKEPLENLVGRYSKASIQSENLSTMKKRISNKLYYSSYSDFDTRRKWVLSIGIMIIVFIIIWLL